MGARQLRSEREDILRQAEALVDRYDDREMPKHEERRYELLLRQADEMGREIARLENGGMFDARTLSSSGGLRIGETERAICHYVRTGDRSGMRDMGVAADGDFPMAINLPMERRAVDSTMNITTPADGGSAVPTGFARQVAARRNEIRLSSRLGVLNVPGRGTTVQFPYQNADAVVFAVTAEQDDAHAQSYERDALVLGSKDFTLVSYTKKIELTSQLLDDEDVGLMNFIAESVGRSIGLTHNNLLITEVAANGTSLKTFASATGIAVDELEPIVFHDTLAHYLDDAGNCGWVMKPSVYGEIALLDDSSVRRYANNSMGNEAGPSLLGYPVYYSSYAGATQASAKSCFFGNWRMVGMREDPALEMIRDPYSVDGLVILKYRFRACYGVLIAGGIGYGSHPTS